MAILLEDANAYIFAYCLDVIDWEVAQDDRKTRYINVSQRTLADAYPDLEIPDAAVFETANAFSIMFNDTNRLQHQGIGNFTLTGFGTVQFRDRFVSASGELDYKEFIPPVAKKLIADANGLKTLSSKVRYTGV